MSGFKRQSPFAKVQETIAKVPACIVDVAPSLWREGRPSKPLQPVKVGLRLLSEEEVERARARAAKDAWLAIPTGIPEDVRIEHYNDRLMLLLMAEATCSPVDVTIAYFQFTDLQIGKDLTPEGIRYLYEHYEAFAVSYSPTSPEPTDAELDGLAEGLATGELLGELGSEHARRVRRLLKAALIEAGA